MADNHKSANQAPRCQHQKLNGSPCGAPALRGRRLCRFHDASHRQKDYSLPLVEDAVSLQFALVQVVRALVDKALDPKTAALVLYALQISAMNLKRLRDEFPSAAGAEEESLAALLLRQLELEAGSAPAQSAVIDAIQAAVATRKKMNHSLRLPANVRASTKVSSEPSEGSKI